MLKQSFKNSHSTLQTLVPSTKLFPSYGAASFGLNKKISTPTRKSSNVKLVKRRNGSSGIKAVLTSTEKSSRVKSVVTVLQTIGGVLKNFSLTQPLDEITDLLGQAILVELVAAELDPSTGEEKATVKAYADKTEREGNESYYECEFEVPPDFGVVGAVLVENQYHKELYVKNITLDGLPTGPSNILCNSWIHSKHDNPAKRIFFCSSKVRTHKFTT